MNGTSISMDRKHDALSPEQIELLKLLLEKKSRETDEIRPRPRSSVVGPVRPPASWAQQRLWFIDHLEGGTAAYNIPLAMRLRGTLDQAALRGALSSLVQRHEALRTVFVEIDGEPVQEISPEGSIALREMDLSGHDSAEREAQVRSHELEEVRQRFDLRVGPLIRARLLRTKEDEHVLLLTIHHIVADGWSMGILLKELAELYTAHRQGRAPVLPALPVQYADYAQWQREWLRGARRDEQLSYWRARLNGVAPQLELPTDSPRPATQTLRGGSVPIELDTSTTGKLNEFAREHGLTLFMVLHAAWAILLHRLSGQEDVVVGTPVANRQRPELESIVGLFVNTLALRASVRAETSLPEFLAQIKEVTLSAYDHQDVPFEQLVETLQLQRSLSRHPLFQVMIALQNAPAVDLSLPQLTASAEDDCYAFSKFDLELYLEERDAHITGIVNYAADLFSRHTIERWVECLKVLLKSMLDRPTARVGELPVLSDRERLLVTATFNDTRSVHAQQGDLIHELFERQVERTPDALAVVYERECATYAELNNRANQLAKTLRLRGAGPDKRVAICVERSLDMVVALLGTLKAGAAYVPLDPIYPSERLAHMLEDSQAILALTQARLRDRLRVSHQCEVLILDNSAWEGGDSTRAVIPNLGAREVGLESSHLASVIYTSGSTGVPKGVMVSHANVLHFLSGLEERIHGVPPDCRRVAWNSSFGFDMAVKAWGQLLQGRAVYIIPEAVRLGADAMLTFLEQHSIEAIECTPSHLRMLRGAGFTQGRARSVRKVLLGGEAIDPATWRALAADRDTIFFNMYGPTECSVDASCGRIDGATPNVGRVMPNARIYILDAKLQPVPVGVVGEIHIGGAGVARGYLNRPELTAQRFDRDPFSVDPHARLYRTGDMGRWNADGTIEFLGRNDDQVKIRGFRIELGEIAAHLTRHPQVKDAVVIAREEAGEKRLIAYVTRCSETGPDVEALRTYLKGALPDYMIPSAFVTLVELPLSRNGKVDRRALPAPALDAYAHEPYIAPTGAVEQRLADIWRDLLRVEQIGRRDNFFELGGHSLLLTRLVARTREAFQVELSLRAVFDAPTVEQLAARITQERQESLAPSLRKEIEDMNDEAVLAQIAELERELGQTVGSAAT